MGTPLYSLKKKFSSAPRGNAPWRSRRAQGILEDPADVPVFVGARRRAAPFSLTVSCPAVPKVLPSSEYLTSRARADGRVRDVSHVLGHGVVDRHLVRRLLADVVSRHRPDDFHARHALSAGTSLVDFSPLASTTSCSISATDFRTMQPWSCANACEPRPQAMMATRPRIFLPLDHVCLLHCYFR